MAAPDPRSACLIGAAQRTWRPGDAEAPEPLEMWAEVAAAAAADSGTGGLLAAVDDLRVLYCQSWQYDDAPGRLAERLGIAPRSQRYSGIGGTMPQELVADAAESIRRGDLDVALVVGGEALATRRRVKKEGRRVEWSHREAERSPFPFEAPFHPAEVAHEVFQAWLTFPVFDVARRAALGIDPDDYRAGIGEMMAPMTQVAARNPHAWFPVERTAAELVAPTAGNRLVGYPYTKYTVAVMDVDMAGALVVASHEAAERLGVPRERRAYLRGWASATDPVYLAEHVDLARSPAMAAAGAEALRRAGAGIEEVAHLDLYSCFASSLHLACDALGISPDDPRGLTVTGGLPFAGGPGSGYLLHALGTMLGVLREDPGSLGLVSGVGMHMTKHTYAVYGTEPGPVAEPDETVQARLDAVPTPTPTIREVVSGRASIVAYTVAHDRDGAPSWGLLIVDLPEGERAYAKVTDSQLLEALEAEEWVGRQVQLSAGGEGAPNLATA